MGINQKTNIEDVFVYKYSDQFFLYSPLDKVILKLTENGFNQLTQNPDKENWKNLLSKYNLFVYSKPQVSEYVSTNQFDGLTFMMTNACNLACKYCYASDYQTKPHFMPRDIWSKTLEYAFDNRDIKSNEFSLAFHGFGECTLAFNDIIEISEAFKEKCKKFGLKPVFQITTKWHILRNRM